MRVFVSILFAAWLCAGCDGNTPLMQAVLSEEAEQVQSELSGSTDINTANNYGWTALSHAARLNNVKIVGLLLDAGADVDLQDNRGWTPLMRAAAKGNNETVQLLLKQGYIIVNKEDY